MRSFLFCENVLLHYFTFLKGDDIISEFQDILIVFDHQDGIALVQKFFDDPQ